MFCFFSLLSLFSLSISCHHTCGSKSAPTTTIDVTTPVAIAQTTV
jgi:hypothetical protein